MIRNEKTSNVTERKVTGKKVSFFILAFAIGYLTSVAIQVVL